MLYRNRDQAGRLLARELLPLKDEDPLILALPRGGVAVAAAVAIALDAPLDVLVVRKLGAPRQPEFGFGAVAGDVRVLDESTVALLGISEQQVAEVTARETAEMHRREKVYRRDMPPLEVEGRTVVIVDDGLATGGTAAAAIGAIGAMGPAKVVLAVPVAPPDTAMRLSEEVDDLVCLSTPSDFGAVGRWYLDFEQTTDMEVIELLRQARKRTAATSV